MELRQLEAFLAVAAELHFGRAAAALHLGQPTLSDMIRRLERELGTPLFTRTTRRVTLTGAGEEFLTRARVILDDVAAATAAVRRVADGDAGTVRIGITPPVAPVLAPHLTVVAGQGLAGVQLDVRRMWLPALTAAVADATVDVAITCGLLPGSRGVVSHVFCAEPLLVGLRENHRLAHQDAVDLNELAQDVLGTPDESLFPAWALSHQQALADAGISPPAVRLDENDLAAAHWTAQEEVDWVLLIGSLSSAHATTSVRPVTPPASVPYTLRWNPDRATSAAVAKFVHLALTCAPPAGWTTRAGHLEHHGD